MHTYKRLTTWVITDGVNSSRGIWNVTKTQHMNIHELQAVDIGICRCCSRKCNYHVKFMYDKTTVISYISRMECLNSETFKSIVYRVREFCIDKKFWILKADLPVYQNKEVDRQSRILDNATKCQLNLNHF